MRRIFLTILALVLCLAFSSPDEAQAEIGKSLKASQEYSFFKFFGLVETARAPNKGGAEVTFKPGGGDFKALVTLTVQVDDADVIQTLTLSVARSFIDTPRISKFARDIAKTLFAEFLPEADQTPVKGLIEEIWHGEISGTTTIHLQGEAPTLPPTSSAGYKAFLGGDAFETTTPGATIQIANVGDQCVITLSKR